MFYAVQATLLSRNMSASSHKGTISQFGEHFIKTNIFPKEIGRELNRAFAKRQVGDYTHSFVVSALEAEQLLESGRTFVAQITQYLKDQKLL